MWKYAFIGITGYGTPINVNLRLLQADLSLAVTMTQATFWGSGGGGSMMIWCQWDS
jgi:nickel-dependent lactate racemase